jgi:predicted permease
MQNILVRAFSLMLVIVLGFIIKKIGWVRKEDVGIFSNLVVKVTLPCAIVTSFNQVNIDYSMLVYVLIGMVCNTILGIVAFLIGMKKGKAEQAFNIINYGSYNIGAFTMPYISNFLGPAYVVIVSLFDVGNVLSASGVNYSIAKSLSNRTQKISFKNVLINMLTSIIFVTYITMFVIRLIGITLPNEIISFTSIGADANTFLAMLMIGIAFDINIDKTRLNSAFKGILDRYLVSIFMALIIYFVLPIPEAGKIVLPIVLFSPIASMATGYTKEIEGDLERSSFMSSLSIIFGIIIMTGLMAIFAIGG